MSPSLALLAWVILLVALLRFDPANDSKVSSVLWVPVIWMFIVGSRLPSQWFGGAMGQSANALEDGNPLDRSIDLVLILISIGTLGARSFRWGDFVRRNQALMAFILFALVSVVWSDFPFVAFKRWFRDLGNYFVILVVLSDPRPIEAIRTVLRRVSYLLIPLSILLIKYFTAIGRQWSVWTGSTEYVGAATSKNMLGLLCLLSGLYFFWDVVTRWSERRKQRAKRIIVVDISFIAMTLWVMNLASSTTSDICLVMGCLVIAGAHSKVLRRRMWLLKAMIPASFVVYLILSLGFNMNGSMAEAVGKDPTLHDRTKIWSFLLSMHTNPVIGTGYQSFWLGSRLLLFWNNADLGHLNEAHNGYLEVYLELGLIGVALLAWFVISIYRTACKRLSYDFDLAVLGLASWIMIVFYNMSEAAFESGLLFIVFLMGALTVPERGKAALKWSALEDRGRDQEFLHNRRVKFIHSRIAP